MLEQDDGSWLDGEKLVQATHIEPNPNPFFDSATHISATVRDSLSTLNET